MIQETQSFCDLFKIFQMFEEITVFTRVSICSFILRTEALKSWEIPYGLDGEDKGIKSPPYLFFDQKELVIRFHGNTWPRYELPLEQMVLGSGLFVQVNASFISVTIRRKSCLIFFFLVSVVWASLFWHWDVCWYPVIHFITLKTLVVASRTKKWKASPSIYNH